MTEILHRCSNSFISFLLLQLHFNFKPFLSFSSSTRSSPLISIFFRMPLNNLHFTRFFFFSMYLSIYLCIYQSIYQSIYLSIRLRAHNIINLSLSVFIGLTPYYITVRNPEHVTFPALKVTQLLTDA